MSAKQDGVASRTPADLERKYNFGKTFAEVMGYATDAQEAADRATDAANRANEAIDGMDQEEIFNRLTNNGQAQGIYRDPETGEIYINASYLATGVITSADGTLQIDLLNNTFTVNQEEVHVVTGETMYSKFVADMNGIALYGTDLDTKELVGTLYMTAAHVGSLGSGISSIKAKGANLVLSAGTMTGEGNYVQIGLPGNTVNIPSSNITLNGKTVSWKDNGDGTFTLIGK